ncbi:hypothetical protein BX616_009836 [Lobosporangium transversale]|uniref:Extracellular membrane protein CFEM domain-containing protein n=1 Tax=Lobosporangium transversale TaxID=64571 RepID=A0A1Y2GYW3_9FUNG|nr:hypothetical protein BCR41DRAFT_358070 [Lobosporangium transversale]XP_021885183.1 hypothetical protein BCR41DRAFT_346798 [Lobosporangium transversale]KAF9913609.1 hypothetical protein BX616_009836 [Lobosporangium transversale]ORZ10004.1 hypothetical protein BCR41DRAFT_358070 [Lobosporangium transversale]ORZ27456.1 hypothetical protein BCR41DRAFT_346798 [Lobosporangium transversale]|eukprot:XP_021879094.1 hypothetical protein BCR41DRAFT_358070 [Lobosporangium transversale]
MHSKSYITLLALVLVLLVGSSMVHAASNMCQGCVDDMAHAVPGCNGIDTSKQASFNELSNKEQQCFCNLGKDVSFLAKCDALCPPGNIEAVQTSLQAAYSVYCNNTKFENGGTSAEGSSNGSGLSALSSPSSASVMYAITAVVLAAVALVPV